MTTMEKRRIVSLWAAITPTLVGVFVFSVEIANANRIAHGIRIAGMPFGGLDAAEARAILEERAARFLDTPIILSGPIREDIRFTPRELGVSIDTAGTLERAWAFGRQGSLVSDLRAELWAALWGRDLSPIVRFHASIFSGTLNRALAPYEQPATNANLLWDPKAHEFRTVAERTGRIFDRGSIEATLRNAAEHLTPSRTITLEIVTDVPRITTADLPEAKRRLEMILAHAPFTVRAGDVRLPLDRDRVAPWFIFVEHIDPKGRSLEVALDDRLVRQFLEAEVRPKVDRDPVNAQFRFVEGRVTTFALARNGQKLDVAAAAVALEHAILAAPERPSETRDIALPVTIREPEIGNHAAEELGIRELLAVGETDFAGSPKNRIYNIHVGASRFQGILVKPGEEFSFNAILGAVGPQTGYKPELVIKQGKTTPEYGGGLCQVSTTAFRAAVAAGLPITERRNHAYIVRYYNPPGFDATIYPPHPDLRFLNDTPGHILIQTAIVGTKLRFEFYGTNDGRSVEIIGPSVYDRKPDGSAKAVLTVRVTASDGTLREQVFRSTYRSPNLYPIERRNPLE